MKTTLKISILSLAFAALSIGANAQSKTPANQNIRLSVGVDAGIPLGNFNNTNNFSLGGSVQADIPVVKQLAVTVNAGYNNLFGSSISGTSLNYTDIRLIPVKAGLKYFPVQNFYVQGEAGASFLVNTSDLGATNSTLFTYAPQIGYLFQVGAKNYIDAGVRFEGNTPLVTNGDNLNFIGLRVAYAFGL